MQQLRSSFAGLAAHCVLFSAVAQAVLPPLLDTPIALRGPFVAPPADTTWTDALSLGIQGRGWPASELGAPFTRLPAKAQQVLCSQKPCEGKAQGSKCSPSDCEATRCAVWGLSTTATGLYFR